MQNVPECDDTNTAAPRPADNPPGHDARADTPAPPARAAAYWRANVSLLLGLLAIWFVVSYGFGILLVDWLNRVSLFGFKLGFWWAQQGAIYVFVALIFVYVALARRLDRKFGVADDSSDQDRQGAPR